ncbi:hypothetical protein M758_9G024100 [Ceratodon purpureus]|nr:hypothetical protein M758_9G024100 [Ceratodon purpureus]
MMAMAMASTGPLQVELRGLGTSWRTGRSGPVRCGLGGRGRLGRRWVIGVQSESSVVGKGHVVSGRRRAEVRRVVADAGAVKTDESGSLIESKVEGEGKDDAVEYDWEKEWYPMYLVGEMPKSAPLGLTVFDKKLVLFYDGNGAINCFEDRCPHRLAKLSEGQVIDGQLECLYHGWQFNGSGQCTKIPQLAPGAKIPKQACAKTYAVKVSQDIIWVWLADKSTADPSKLPWFEHYEKEGFQHISSIHELPYDYSILLENLMDPAHIPISHDRTDRSAKRENAQALVFEVTERSSRGFAGVWKEISSPTFTNTTRFEAPCCLRNDKLSVDDKGKEVQSSAVFLCRPAGQGKSMLIVRFGSTGFPKAIKSIPSWLIHSTSSSVFEQDMGFLASQNEYLIKTNRPTKDLYLNLKSSDTWVSEFRKWNDKTGHGMPYYFGHETLSLPKNPALTEAAPAGVAAATASTYPAQGSFGQMFARDPTNRYFRHVVHCKSCLSTLNAFQKYQKVAVALGLVAAGVAITLSSVIWRASLVALALMAFAAAFACSRGIAKLTQNFVRPHRK